MKKDLSVISGHGNGGRGLAWHGRMKGRRAYKLLFSGSLLDPLGRDFLKASHFS